MMRTTSTHMPIRTQFVEVPLALVAYGIHAWSVTEPDGTLTLCLDAMLSAAAAAAASSRLLARAGVVPPPRAPAA